MESTIRDFFSALNEQESITSGQIKDDHLGLLIRSAITELDWYSYNYYSQCESTEEQTEQLYILRLGALRLTHIALNSHESFAAPAFMYIRNKDNASKLLSIASALGFIQHGRRVAQAAENGVCQIMKNSDQDFSITLPDQISDPEFYETQLSKYYLCEYENIIKNSEFHKKKTNNEEEIKRLARDLVFPFMRHWIGYGAHPLIDDYFFAKRIRQFSPLTDPTHSELTPNSAAYHTTSINSAWPIYSRFISNTYTSRTNW